MFSLDDRTGNVVTTVAIFMIAATILYMLRGDFLVLALSLLLAYLIEPAVTWIQKHSRVARGNRTWAIAQVLLIGAVVLGSLAFQFGPSLSAQLKNLNAALPGFVERLSSGKTMAGLQGRHGLSAAQQLRIQDALTRHHDFIAHVFERSAEYVTDVAAGAIWLFAIFILAIFILHGRCRMSDAIIEAAGRSGNGTLVRRILQRVDTMLAKYVRAQLALAGLSSLFYIGSMLVLRFPYAFVLGILGGVLEFLPAVGWIASAAAILTIGSLSHLHWIWMAGLLILWRLVLNYSISPRVMGKNLELQPLTVVLALIVGGQLGGIAGLYLSAPMAAVLRIVWIEYFSTRPPSTTHSEQQLEQVKA